MMREIWPYPPIETADLTHRRQQAQRREAAAAPAERMQDEPLAVDRGRVAGDSGRDMDLKAGAPRRSRHRQAMRHEIPVFGNEIENLLRHQVDNLCRRDKTISM